MEVSTGTVTIELELRGPGFVHLRGIIHQEEGSGVSRERGSGQGGGSDPDYNLENRNIVCVTPDLNGSGCALRIP